MKRIGILIIGGMVMLSCAGQRPENLGVKDGRLADCPGSPNCINSQAADKTHGISCLNYQSEKLSALKKLKKIITSASFKGSTIIKETDNYLYVECRSSFMGFIDDVEFFFPDEKIIHVRSASRLGYSDFGVNRKRVERIQELFSSKLPDTGE